MEQFFLQKTTELKREKDFLERTLKVKIIIKKNMITVVGEAVDEYEALRVLEAMSFGFSARTAAMIVDEDTDFEIIHIKDHTRRKNLELVKGRLIGTHGKTKNTIEQIADCELRIKGSDVAVIAPAEEMQYVVTAITNIIKGTKQQNSYKYLERINTKRKKELPRF